MEKSSVTINLSAALAIFDDQLPDIRKACVENIRYIATTHQPAKELDVDKKWTVDDIHQAVNHYIIEQQTKPIMTVIKRIDGRKKHYASGNVTEADIDRAREYPIADVWHELVNTPIKGGMVECPFHNDGTPSMSLRKHNRYKCFGCDAKGDVIDLYMKIQEVDFITAVRKLI